jgi:penicillin-binding protein 2
VLPRKIATLAVAISASVALAVSLAIIPAVAAPVAFYQSSSATAASASSTSSPPVAHPRSRLPLTRRRRVIRHRRRGHARHYVARRAAHYRRRPVVRRRRVRRARRRVVAYRRPVRYLRYRHASYARSPYHHLRYRHALYHRYLPWSPWSVRSINLNPGLDDDVTGEDAEVRAAAVKALGHLNGSVVVVDPNTGRILSVVNQKLAFTRGYIPCSTVKPMVALAGLKEGVVTLNTRLRGMYRPRIAMAEALARSDNRYFAQVGEMLGFQRVEHYAELLGYGQRAALDIPDESPGVFPSQPPPAKIGGVGRLTSFGTGIDQTPLQMAALVSAIANGGTLYWLQWPRTPEEVANFTPKVRRVLTGLTPYIPEVRQGMAGAVLYGTARLAYNPFEDIFGKTGTCSEDGGRMGWFISFAQQQQPEYVVVVMLRGGRPMFGPHAAEVAGNLYRALLPQQGQAAQALSPPAILTHPGQ